jgi:hypothetical protein
MRRVRGAAAGVWDFIAGDDWVTAAGVVASLGVTALIMDADAAWVVMPIAVAALLGLSVWREARKHAGGPQ